METFTCSAADRIDQEFVTTEETKNSSSIPQTSKSDQTTSTRVISLPSNTVSPKSVQNDEVTHLALPSIHTTLKNNQSDRRGLEMIELQIPRKQSVITNISRESNQCAPSIIEHYGENETQRRSSNSYSSAFPPLPARMSSTMTESQSDEEYDVPQKRSLPVSLFLLEIGALVMVFILSMVVVLAIREEQVNLRTTMQFVYSYIYLISIFWMIWCIFDILKFRRQWLMLTLKARDQSEYMEIVEQNPQRISYFPDIHNTGGLFMRIGTGVLCMGSVLLTVIELAKAIEILRSNAEHTPHYPRIVFISKSITFILRFLFHCVQFTFIFRYGNIIIDRYHFIAKIGLIHILIANFCTWFEAIVIETLEQLHKRSKNGEETHGTPTFNTTRLLESTTSSQSSSYMVDFFQKAAASKESASNHSTTNPLEYIEKIQSILSIYLYPCLIEYSLVAITVFYIMWRNVGKSENRTFAHFSDRHVFTVNCSRASGGLLLGGIMLLLTILTLIPDYIVDPSIAVPITHITELVLLVVSFFIICMAFVSTSKLYYDKHAHVDTFDQILIFLTTIGDFAYTLFGLFASIFIENYTIDIPRFVEILIGFIALLETFLQSAFILDTLKRRTMTKVDQRKKPGRELITALLLINLAMWMHDSLSGKKAKFNPLQTEYYDPGTWAIIQAFTSPLSIFYRFHSSVCLADIWHEIYRDHRLYSQRKPNDNQHHLRR